MVSNDGRSTGVRATGPFIVPTTEDGSTVGELEGSEVAAPVSNFLIRRYIYINPRGILPEISE